MIILFKYCTDVENYESFKCFSYIYIYTHMKRHKIIFFNKVEEKNNIKRAHTSTRH